MKRMSGCQAPAFSLSNNAHYTAKSLCTAKRCEGLIYIRVQAKVFSSFSKTSPDNFVHSMVSLYQTPARCKVSESMY